MKKVITYGVFDFLHLGHVRLFENIKKLVGDNVHLTVAVHADKYIHKTKQNANVLYNESERVEFVSAIKYVDDTVIYDLIDIDLPSRDFDILAVGPDQTNQHFINAIKWCEQHNKQVIIIPRTENICSSNIKTSITRK